MDQIDEYRSTDEAKDVDSTGMVRPADAKLSRSHQKLLQHLSRREHDGKRLWFGCRRFDSIYGRNMLQKIAVTDRTKEINISGCTL